ncbi:MAG: PBP1A family penicillin-binding protein [Pseudomonadota bacterium]
MRSTNRRKKRQTSRAAPHPRATNGKTPGARTGQGRTDGTEDATAASPSDSRTGSRSAHGDGVLRAPRRIKPKPKRTGVFRWQGKKKVRADRRLVGVRRVVSFTADISFYLFAGAIALSILSLFVIIDLPSTDGLWQADRAPRATLTARDGQPIAAHGQLYGAPVRLSDLPAHVPDAFIAIEDRNFYHHIGVNVLSIVRAAFVNLRDGSVRQGGSTITQQLAKNLFLSSDRTLKRKISELYLALWLEQRFSKEQILTLYLNRVYFGAGAYGVGAASYRYFGIKPSELSVSQAAILAGLIKAPSVYTPDRNPSAAGRRARLVIDAMVDAGKLSIEDARTALDQAVAVNQTKRLTAPYFVDHAINEARTLIEAKNEDIDISTTFDAHLQRAAEEGLAAGTVTAELTDDLETAIVVLDGAGAVRALVGGRSYARSQFNRVTMARRQPGSAFKPFIYLAALEYGLPPDMILNDRPLTVDGWSPKNYKGKYRGPVSLSTALALSLNAATIQLQERTGRSAVRLTARRMGFDVPLSRGAALGLGVDVVTPLELAAAYTPFANGGYRIRPHTVNEVHLFSGALAYQNAGSVIEQAVSPRTIKQVNRMLEGVVEWGTGKKAALPFARAAGKTGTSQENRDAWFVGHAGGLVCAVWVGRDDNRPMAKDSTGGRAPAIIWSAVMSRALGMHMSMNDTSNNTIYDRASGQFSQAPPRRVPPDEFRSNGGASSVLPPLEGPLLGILSAQ